MKRFYFIVIFLIYALSADGQSVSISTGFGMDLNNSQMRTKFFPVEMQWFPFRKNNFCLYANYDIGIPVHKKSEGFTLDPELPGKMEVAERRRINLLTLGINANIRLFRIDSAKLLWLSIMPLAASFNYKKVTYADFDQINYILLDQDFSHQVSGMVMGIGLHFKAENKLISLNIQTPLLKLRREPREYKYRFISPLRLLIGYNFPYKKIK